MRRLVCLLMICSLLLSACGKTSSPDHTDASGEMTWQQQYDMGIRLLNEGKYEDAILVFQALLEIDPKSVDVYKGLADVYAAMGDFEAAAAVILNGIEVTGEIEALEVYLLGLEEKLQGVDLSGGEDQPKETETESREEIIETESPYSAEVMVSLDKISQLFAEGATGLITAADITLYGTPVVGLNFDTAVSIVEANGIRGWSSELNDRVMYQGADDSASDQLDYFYTSQLFDRDHVYCVSYEDNSYFDEPGHLPVGVSGIYMNSSMETTLTQLGYGNASQIVAEVQQLLSLTTEVDDIYRAVKEMKQVGPMQFAVSRGSQDGVSYISYVTFRMIYPEVSISFTYDTQTGYLQQVYTDFNNLYKYQAQ